MEQEQNNISNNELKVKYYRKTGQREGMIAQITLNCSLGEISLNVFKEKGIITAIRQGVIPTNDERKIIKKYGIEHVINIVKEYVNKEQ